MKTKPDATPEPSQGFEALALREQAGGVSFEVRVAPRAAKQGVLGVHGGALKLSLTAPAVEGAANAALIEFLAELVALPKRAVRIVRGEHSRNKSVFLSGIDAAAVRSALGAAASRSERSG